jgi:hypothetical protein
MAAKLHATIAADVCRERGEPYLQCSICGRKEERSEHAVEVYLANGWPECCGYTMTLKFHRRRRAQLEGREAEHGS